MDLSSVTDFLSSEAGKHVPELANPSAELLQQAQQLYMTYGGRLPSPPIPEPLRPSKKLEDFTKQFEYGINDVLSRSRDNEARQAFTNSSWDELQAEATKAWTAYDNHLKRKLKRNLLRQPFEVLDHTAERVMTSCYIEFLLALMPNGDYSSLLSGGLTLAYNTAVRKEKIREDILKLFDSLSERAKQTKANIKLYSRDPELHVKSEELYMAVLDCVRVSTAWLISPSALESFKAFFQQSRYGTNLDDAKENLDKKVKEFEDTVNMCLRREVHDIYNNVEWIKKPTMATFSLLAGFIKDFPALLAAELHRQAQQSQPQVTNWIQSPAYPMYPPQQKPATITSWQLRQCLALEYTSTTPETGQDAGTVALFELDANISTAMGHIPPLPQREKMGFLTLSSQFVTWLRGIESTFLVVHESETSHQGVVSTLSHLCGLMARTMHTPEMWTLAFFCGLHTAAGAKLQGGRGLMRAVILQLLSTIPNATFPISGEPSTVAQRLMVGDLETICSVFFMILCQLPAGMVFVLIDGAHWNSTEARSAEMRAVMRFLHKMVVEKLPRARRGLVLKVLVTNPSARQRAEWGIAENDLHMERQVLAGGHQGAESQVIAGAVAKLPGY